MFAISKDQEKLLASKSTHKFKFKFVMEEYAFMAICLTNFDKNLPVVREDLVPDEIAEEDFWENYFYEVETIKKKYELPNMIGDELGD